MIDVPVQFLPLVLIGAVLFVQPSTCIQLLNRVDWRWLQLEMWVEPWARQLLPEVRIDESRALRWAMRCSGVALLWAGAIKLGGLA